MPDLPNLLALTVAQFAASTAAKTPTPGGGSVAGVVGCLGTALGEMSLVFTRGKKAFAAHEADYAAMAGRLGRARDLFTKLVADDVAAYTLYQQAGQATGADKEEKTQLALAAAIDVPREMTALSLAVLADLLSLADRCNPWLVSDLLAGAILAEAVVRLCHCNVRVNAGSYADAPAAKEVYQASLRDCGKAREILSQIETKARSHLYGEA